MRTHGSRLFNRKDESHHDAEQWRAPASWSFTGPGVDSDDQPLIDADPQAGGVKKPKQVRKKGKAGQKLSGLSFVPFLRQKTNWGTPTPHGPLRRLLPSLTSTPSWGSARGAQNPFGDEHAIDANANVNTVRGGGRGRGRDATVAEDEEEEMEMEVDAHEGLFPVPVPVPSTPSSTQGAFFPTLAAALSRSASTPTTPKRSPNRRSSGSFKSFRSETSRLSGRSPASSLLHKHKRRRERDSGAAGHDAQRRSMRKTVQVLGPEAAGAVAMGTDVSPDWLLCEELGRKLQEQLKGDV